MNYVTRGRKFVRDVMTRSAVKRPLMPAAIISEGVKFKKDEFHVGLQCKVMVYLRDKRCVSVNHAELSRKYLWGGAKHYEEMNYRHLYSNVVKWTFSKFSRICQLLLLKAKFFPKHFLNSRTFKYLIRNKCHPLAINKLMGVFFLRI